MNLTGPKNEIGVKNDRLIGLDFFRVFSMLVVFFFHSVTLLECQYGFLSAFVHMGAVFMTGFFILSGFTLFITWKNKELSDIHAIKIFYKRRFISIYPLYWLASPALGLIYLGIKGLLLVPVEVLGIQSTFVSLSDYIHNSNTWFISCLVICYLLYPLGQLCVKQFTVKDKWRGIIICGAVLLWAPLIVNAFHTESVYGNPFYRCLEFFIGIILASLYENLNKNKHSFLFTWKCFLIELFILIGGVSLLFYMDIGRYDYMLYNWIALPVFICMIFTLAGVRVNRVSGLIQYFSAISYCFYLAQSWIWELTKTILTVGGIDGNGMRIGVSLALCLILAVLLHEIFEKPISRFLRKRWNV